MSFQLRSATEIAAVVASSTYAAISTARKNQLVDQLRANATDLDIALPNLLANASAPEAKFIRAVVVSGESGTPVAPPTTSPTTPTTGGGNTQKGTVAIPLNADHVDVVFPAALGSAPPPPACTVLKAAAGDDDLTVLDVVNLTGSGFRAVLSAATSNANYVLGYQYPL